MLLSVREFELPPSMWFLGPTGPYTVNIISIGSAVFAGLTDVTNTHGHIDDVQHLGLSARDAAEKKLHVSDNVMRVVHTVRRHS